MLIQNKHTKKQYATTKERWNALSARNKAVFIVLDETDPGSAAVQKITNTVKKDPPKNNTPKPNTGEKSGGDKKDTHKNKK